MRFGGDGGTPGVYSATLAPPCYDSSPSSSLSNSFILTAGSASRLVCPGTSPSALSMQFLKAAGLDRSIFGHGKFAKVL
jgi:hypothetical protein